MKPEIERAQPNAAVKRLLKVKEVAVVMGIGYQAVLDLIHGGELPTVQIPGRRSFRVDAADVDALISGLKVGLKVGLIDETEPTKTQENARPSKKAKSGEFVVKPL